MTRYIKRHSLMKRWIHGIHMAACIVLIFTGAVVFIPALGRAVGTDVVDAVRIGHRIFAVLFIGVPLIGAIMAPSGLKHMLKNTFAKWDADDKKFMVLFLPYLFASKKIHMPKQHEVKSGQRLADGALVLFAVTISLSGIVLWASQYVGLDVFRIALFIHDVSFFGVLILTMAHGYLGSGLFQPYRGLARIMFGDGMVSEADARYHWGYWAEEEIASGKNVVVVED